MAIRLGRVVPPSAVAPAFADAARARSDRRQAITRAEEYRDRTQSEARGQAREIADVAAGRVDRLVQPARGEAARFTSVLAEARKSPGPFRQRLFLETLAELLPRFRRTVVVPPGQDLDISLFGDEAPSADRRRPLHETLRRRLAHRDRHGLDDLDRALPITLAAARRRPMHGTDSRFQDSRFAEC